MGGEGNVRGGTRGGRDQFSWDDVKTDAHREHYLGHSVMATTGRWCKGKDVFWYAREKADDDDDGAGARRRAEEELATVKAREDAALAEALGLPPPVSSSGRTKREEDDEDRGRKRRGKNQSDYRRC